MVVRKTNKTISVGTFHLFEWIRFYQVLLYGFPLISSTFISSPHSLNIDWHLHASFSLGVALTKKVDLHPPFLYQSFCFCSFSFLRLPIFQNLLLYSGIVPEISLFRLS